MLNNLHQPYEESLDTVQRLGIPAVHLSADGPWNPAICDGSARKQLRASLVERGLALSAISGCGRAIDLGWPDQTKENIATAQKALEMAADLMDTGGIWQDHVGVLPNRPEGRRWDAFVRCTRDIARHGEKVGACLAIETGPEPAYAIENLMRAVGSKALRVNYDPANLILYPAFFHTDPDLIARFGRPSTPYEKESAFREYEPVEGVQRLGPYIVHTHAKDALVDAGVGREVPLGMGWVDWPRYLRLLKESGYTGYLAIERETGPDPVGDIARAAAFLREQLQSLG